MGGPSRVRVAADCDRLGDELARAVAGHMSSRGCDCVLFSGGIDTSFIASSALEAGLRPRLVTVELPGASDGAFSRRAAEALGLQLLVAPSDEESMRSCVRDAVLVTRSIDPIEIAADAAVCLGLRAARDLGCRCVATGDGGDELFLGYPFLFSYGEKEVERWYSRVLTGSRFASRDLGPWIGVRVELPLYTDEARRIALEAPLECKVGRRDGRAYGKLLMRRRLERVGLAAIAWRDKVPVTDGSGASSLILRWSSEVGLEAAIEASRRSGIAFPSRAHVRLYLEAEAMGIGRPGRCSDPSASCPTCGSCMDGGFCRFCGTYVGDGGTISHYSDDLWDKLRANG